jgi:YegS/Rv2252/BmrU family lipid kinase
MLSINSFFLIVNPNAGTGNFQKSWQRIQECLNKQEVDYSFSFTQYPKHEILLVEEAIQQGFRNIISVGGDGTLHHVLNGMMRQRYIKSSEIKLGVIPLGTGNDWIKTYHIPKDINQAVKIIKKLYTDYQDVGYIQLEDSSDEYFINMAGIGYDGYVVNKLNTLKKFGSIAYLLSGLQGLLFYKKSNYHIEINNERVEEKCLMILFGICQYSGGGMQITKESDPKDGLLDVTIAKNFSFLDLILNLPKLYNGKIVEHPKVDNFKATSVKIIEKSKSKSFVEADGELIGKGSLEVSMIPKAIQIIVPPIE